jgi:hypothetical protein
MNESHLSGVSSCKGTNPITGVHHHDSSNPNYLPIYSKLDTNATTLGIKASLDFGGHEHSVPLSFLFTCTLL